MGRMDREVGLVTTDLSQFNYGDPDAKRLADALATRGFVVSEPSWRDPEVDWARYDALVIRSPWDYAVRPREFDGWMERVSELTRLFNPAELIRWNADKTYLLELQALGVAIPPTDFCSDEGEVGRALASRPNIDIVVKPNISAGSRLTGLFGPDDADRANAGKLALQILDEGKKVMVQDAVSSVAGGAERGLLFFGGEYSHAFSKGPILEAGGGLLGGEYQERIDKVLPTAAEKDFARATLEAVAEIAASKGWGEDAAAPLYARIDLATTEDGQVLLMEAELFEPSLYFSTADAEAPRRMAAQLVARLDAEGASLPPGA